MWMTRGAGAALGALGVLMAACGSSSESSGDDNTLLADGTQNGGPGSPGFGGSGETGSSGPSGVTPGSACATSSAIADALPVYLVFMFDRSGSMSHSSKWTSCKDGLESFFGDPKSRGLVASMAFFSQADECNASAYATPTVAMKALPDATTFKTHLEEMRPSGGTPTLPALNGAIQYAQRVRAGLSNGEKVAIVLVTDGDPNDCNSTAQNVGAAAAKVASTIPTYVIGVGPEAKNLNTIAKGGGTSRAIMIATNNPAQITQDLQKAIGNIKMAQLGCDYIMPKPPNGQSIDVNAVNVAFTPGGGKAQPLTYSKDCSNPNGWHYDDLAAPTKVQMCSGICGALKSDTTGGKIDIVFGCKTQGGVPK